MELLRQYVISDAVMVYIYYSIDLRHWYCSVIGPTLYCRSISINTPQSGTILDSVM